MLPPENNVVKCITKRASTFQGLNSKDSDIRLQATIYGKGQEFKTHVDWHNNPDLVMDRLSTIFGILDVSCGNCGTQFPRVEVDWSKKDPALCDFFECGDEVLTAKAVAGSALYWRNLFDNGTGDPKTLHAGLPLPEGTKTGLNVWTRVPVQL